MTPTFSDRIPSKTAIKPAGFTLVELMIAITIGIIILGALSQVFVTSRSTYIVEEGLARVQENGRFAMNFITEDIRMAGYMGCQDQAGQLNNRLNDPSGDYWPLTPPGGGPVPVITGFEYVGSGSNDTTDWLPNLPAAYFADGEVQPFTDVLIIRRGSDMSLKVVGAPSTPAAVWMNQETDDLYIPTGNTLSQWDIVMVADCKAADLFQITSPTNDVQNDGRLAHSAVAPPPQNPPGNQLPALSQVYGANAEVFTLVSHAYFVGTGANNVPALFRKQITAGNIETAELVDNVESLQVFYGVDTDNTGVANQYQVANAIIGLGWATVTSVRVGLLARTPDEHGVDVDTNTYDVVGDPSVADDFDPTDDRRQRRVFTSTVNVRNYTLFTRG